MSILESESNQDYQESKYNRVDLKVQNEKGEIVIIEVQYNTEYDYFHRVLFAASKTIVGHLDLSDKYDKVVKVISVSILYFNLGDGLDYIYTGTTNFVGLHHKDQLKLSPKQQQLFKKEMPSNIFPEYYLINVRRFDDVAKTTLDEWIYFLKHEKVKDSFTAKGLQEAKEILDIMKLTKEQRAAYDVYIADIRSQRSAIDSARFDGLLEGKKEGIAIGKEEGIKIGEEKGIEKGRKEEKLATARILLSKNMDTNLIAGITGLTKAEISKLKADNKPLC